MPGAADEARRAAQSLSDAGLRWVDEFIESRRDSVAEELGGIARALRATARTLDEQQQPHASSLADAAAQRVDAFSESLRASDLHALLARLQGLARRQPALLVGGALAIGFVFARWVQGSRPPTDGGPFATAGASQSSDRAPTAH